MFYVLPIILCVASLPSLFSNRKRVEHKVFIFVVAVLTILFGLRDTAPYPDMANYNSYFYTGEIITSYATTENINIGYEWLNKLFLLGGSFQVFVFFITFVILYSFSKTIYKYSPYLFFSLFLFCITDFHLSCFLLRQYLAVALCLLSIPFIIERKLLGFLICIIIGTSLHTAALAFMPLYFIYRENITHSYKVRIFVGFALALLLGGTLVIFVSSFLNLYYQKYFLYEGEGSYSRLIMKIYLLLVYLYVLKKEAWTAGINQLVLFMLFMSIFVCVCGIDIPIFFRMRMMFSISDILGIPLIVYYNKKNKSLKKLIINSMILLYIVVLTISYNNTLIDNELVNAFDLFWRV